MPCPINILLGVPYTGQPRLASQRPGTEAPVQCGTPADRPSVMLARRSANPLRGSDRCRLRSAIFVCLPLLLWSSSASRLRGRATKAGRAALNERSAPVLTIRNVPHRGIASIADAGHVRILMQVVIPITASMPSYLTSSGRAYPPYALLTVSVRIALGELRWNVRSCSRR